MPSEHQHPHNCNCAHCSGIQNPENIGEAEQNSASFVDNGPDRLLSGYSWANNKTGLNLKYTFWNSLPSYYEANAPEAVGFRAFSQSMKNAAIDVLNHIETFTNISFTLSSGESNNQIGFAQASLPNNTGAWAYLPSLHRAGGDVWTDADSINDSNLNKGQYGYYVLLHEMGHALGLQHSFSGGLTGDQNTEQYTVMSYDHTPWNGQFAQTFQLYDIWALQNLYGANTTYNTGDNVYTLESGKAYTIWDAGGVDTLDGSALSSDLVIGLKEGNFSSVGLTDNLAIAYNVVIENAKGGSGDDIIDGNDANNSIDGNGGDDIIYGSVGDDIIDGGEGKDTITYTDGIENFVISILDYSSVLINNTRTNFSDLISNIENFIFNDISYQLDDLTSFSNGYDLEGRPLITSGAVFADSAVTYGPVSNSADINLSTSTNKTIGISFETDADIQTRQVLFEQGGGLRGMNITIENGELHYAAWNYRAGVQWGFKSTSIEISSNVRYTSAFVFEATSKSSGTLEIHLNGEMQSSINGVGYIYPESAGVGIGMMNDQSRFSNGNARGNGYEFKGDIDRIAYYNQTLDTAELQQLQQHLDFDWSINLAPTAQDDDVVALTDTPTQIDVLSNDSDPNNDSINVVSSSQGAYGSVTINEDNTLLYTPDNGFIGLDSFTYTIEDEDGLSASATVNVETTNEIRVDLPTGAVFAYSAVTYGPVSNSADINLSTSTNKTIGISFETDADIQTRQVLFEQGGGLRGMNITIENGELHYAAWNYRAGVQWGFKSTSVEISSNVRYTSAFVFEATSKSSGTLELHLNGEMQSSINGVGYIYPESAGVGIGMMHDQSRFSNGNARGNGYEFKGNIDRIAYYNQTLDTAELQQLQQHLDFDWSINLAPTAQEDDLVALADTPTQIDVLSNDSDPNNDSINVVSSTQGAHGSVTINADNTLLYTPDNSFIGLDSFTYTIEDEDGLSASATVNVETTNEIRVDLPTGAVFADSAVTYGPVSNSADINLSTSTNKTIGISFETDADIQTRQVLFEQGGGLRGMNITIENGELHYAAWNYRAGVQWGFKSTSIEISSNVRYTSAFVFEATSKSSGTLEIHLNGEMQSSINGVGYIYPESAGVGIGMMHDQSRFSNGNARGNGYEFKGDIDRIAYYNQTLDTAELQQLQQHLSSPIAASITNDIEDINITISDVLHIESSFTNDIIANLIETKDSEAFNNLSNHPNQIIDYQLSTTELNLDYFTQPENQHIA